MGIVKLALKLFIAGYILYTAILFAIPFVKFKIYEAAAKKIITNEVSFSTEKVREFLLKEAEDISIDIVPDNITIEDFEKYLKITVKYESKVRLPLTKKIYIFEHQISGNREKKENNQ